MMGLNETDSAIKIPTEIFRTTKNSTIPSKNAHESSATHAAGEPGSSLRRS